MEIKLCKDCKHFTEQMPQCHSPNNFSPDYVNGGADGDARFWSAQAVRIGADKCGPEGNWFEPLNPTYWDEKAKDRREEFKEEDAVNRERAYPERQP